MKDGRLKIIIDSDKVKHDQTAMKSKARDDLAERFKDLDVTGKETPSATAETSA
jgi:hypothetical protein